MKTINRIFRAAFFEVQQIMKDQGLIIFILFLPLAYPLLYGMIYNNEAVNDVPAAIVDDNRSPESREFARRIDATQGASVYPHCTSMAEAKQLMQEGRVYGIIRIPSSFSKDLDAGRQTRVGVYCNMSSTLYFKSLALAVNEVALSSNRQIMVDRHMQTTTDRQAQIAQQPVDYRYVALYNTQSGFATFIIPPVLMVVLQQSLALALCLSMGRAREMKRFGDPKFKEMYQHPFAVMAGKSLIYLPIYIIMAVYLYAGVTRMFTLPNLGDFADFLTFMIPYLLACIFFAMTLSVFVSRREDCMMLIVALTVPMLFLSGVPWPSVSMPYFCRMLSYAIPSTFGTNGYVKLNSMGASLQDIHYEYVALWIQVVVYGVLASIVYRFEKVK